MEPISRWQIIREYVEDFEVTMDDLAEFGKLGIKLALLQ
jgi:hypothetical protein